ncbi:MAG: hypothetical protein KJO21_11740 [Verrucomicrobiae bacterium]|nr:hypothetical protein [Verrucomicrobiae bacterium]
MAGSLQTIKARVEPNGTVRLLQPVYLDHAADAVLTFHIEEPHEPNAETRAALEESTDELERFDSVEALFADLEN